MGGSFGGSTGTIGTAGRRYWADSGLRRSGSTVVAVVLGLVDVVDVVYATVQ